MADRWIIAKHRFHEHVSLDAAETEFARLREKFPGQKFRIYRVKTTLVRSNAEAVIKRLQNAIALAVVSYRGGDPWTAVDALCKLERISAETNSFPPSAPNAGDRTVVPPSPPSPEPNLN
jgi:hypothetical protein